MPRRCADAITDTSGIHLGQGQDESQGERQGEKRGNLRRWEPPGAGGRDERRKQVGEGQRDAGDPGALLSLPQVSGLSMTTLSYPRTNDRRYMVRFMRGLRQNGDILRDTARC